MVREDLAARLVGALGRRDDLALASVLDPGVRMVVDAGDVTGGDRRGRAAVARELTTLLRRHPDAALEAAQANGASAACLRRDSGEAIGVLVVGRCEGGAIVELWLCTATGKLTAWSRQRLVSQPDDLPGPSW